MTTWTERLDALHRILGETTIQLRKGEVLEGTPELVEQAKLGLELTAGGVLTVNAMPHEDEAWVDHFEKVDLYMLTIGVDKELAEARKAALVDILDHWENPSTLADGPSYITTGAEIGDQGAAFQLFALGKVLGLWSIITPTTFGYPPGPRADEAAGAGLIMITGYRPAGAVQ